MRCPATDLQPTRTPPAGMHSCGGRLQEGQGLELIRLETTYECTSNSPSSASTASFVISGTSTMSSAALQLGQQLVTALLPTTLATGTQLVVSPLSVWFALLLLLSGSGPSSLTLNELWRVTSGNSSTFTVADSATAVLLAALNSEAAALRAALKRQSVGENNLTIADALWTKDIALKPEYAGEMQRLFNATARSVSSAGPINAWAAESTNNTIKKVLEGSDFNLVVTNAIYFKGIWENTFEKSDTRPRDFKAMVKGSPSQLTTVQVPTMFQKFCPRDVIGSAPRPQVATSEAAGKYRAVHLPYKNSPGLAAVFVLPDESHTSVADAARDITGQMVLDETAWKQLSGSIPENCLEVFLPKFELRAEVGLKEALQSMGVVTSFTTAADFSGISSTSLMLTDVKQVVYVRVDEAGTEAAAVTVAQAVRSAPGVPPPVPKLVFDRPFLFFLVETTTQTVIFQGAVTDPRG